MKNREKNLWIADYLRKHGEPSIGVYGCGTLGKHLIWELEKKDYPITWIMDKEKNENLEENILLGLKEINIAQKVDIIIVTAVADFEEVEMLLCAYDLGKPLGLDELIGLIDGGVK